MQTPSNDEKVTVWRGFTASTGPSFFKEMRHSRFETVSVTGERYADMLHNRIILSLADKYLLKSTALNRMALHAMISGK